MDSTPRGILIAGGATGIGLACLRAFSARGDAVVLADIQEGAAQRAVHDLPGPAFAVACDLATETGPGLAVREAVDRMGRLDVVVANAAVLHSAPLHAWTIGDWDRSVAVNLRAPFLLSQAAAPHMLESGGGSLIFTSSTGAFRGHAGMPAYHATKTGLLGLVRSLADELSPQGIRVNAICPGWIDTPFNDPYWSFQPDPEAGRRHLEAQIPLRRLGSPEDVAEVVLFLASGGARYVTGTALVIDGGYSAV